jgi:hypothetical protein
MVSQSSGFPQVGPLYLKMTTPRNEGGTTLNSARDIFGSLSQTSQFKVALHMNSSYIGGDDLNDWLYKAGVTRDAAQSMYYDFFCSDVVIPGATLDVAEEMGSRQGVIERMPTRRVFAPVQMTFYVDKDFLLARLFEEWMNFINPIHGLGGGGGERRAAYSTSGGGYPGAKNRNDFYRMRYPDEYKRIISIVKFERDFRDKPHEAGDIRDMPITVYRLIDAFPSNISAIPLSYEGTDITKVTIEMTYTRYVYERNVTAGNNQLLPDLPKLF